MATTDLDLDDFPEAFRERERARLAVVRGAVLEAALLGAEVVARAVPVDVGTLKASVRAVEDTIVVGAPHAATIERGARPHWAPLQPLIDWVRRHRKALGLTRRGRDASGRFRGASESEITAAAQRIQYKIAHHGSPPRWYMRNALPALGRILQRLVNRRLREANERR